MCDLAFNVVRISHAVSCFLLLVGHSSAVEHACVILRDFRIHVYVYIYIYIRPLHSIYTYLHVCIVRWVWSFVERVHDTTPREKLKGRINNGFKSVQKNF